MVKRFSKGSFYFAKTLDQLHDLPLGSLLPMAQPRPSTPSGRLE